MDFIIGGPNSLTGTHVDGPLKAPTLLAVLKGKKLLMMCPPGDAANELVKKLFKSTVAVFESAEYKVWKTFLSPE